LVRVVEITGDGVEKLSEIAPLVAKGKLIIYPTDTVYGLGTSPYLRDSVLKVFKLKKRELGKPLPILTSSIDKAKELVEFNELAEELAVRFWPGPLTLVLPLKAKNLPSYVHGGTSKLGVRIPNHEIALTLIKLIGGYLIGTSANISNYPPPTSAEEALNYFANVNDDLILIDGGPTPLKTPSTVVDLTVRPPRLLRIGALKSYEVLKVVSNAFRRI